MATGKSLGETSDSSHTVDSRKANIPACPLCGKCSIAEMGHTTWRMPDPLSDIVIRIAYCRDCDFGYAAPMPSDREIQAYFSDNGAYNEPELIEHHERLRRYTARQIIHIMEEVTPPPASLLDVGSAHGHLLHWASQTGYSVRGFEISGGASACATELLGAGVTRYATDLAAAGYAEGTFDVVTLIDALYYCREPVALLRTAAKLMKPDGYLLVRLTNRLWARKIASHLGTEFRFGGDGILWFSIRSIRRALALGGLVLEKVVPVYGTPDNHGGMVVDIALKALAYSAQWVSAGHANIHPSLLVLAKPDIEQLSDDT